MTIVATSMDGSQSTIRRTTRTDAVEDAVNESTIRHEIGGYPTFQGVTEVDLTSTPSAWKEVMEEDNV
jgi:hypothetical protein